MARLFRDHPDGIARTLEIVERCRFSLDALAYEYPDQPVPEGTTPDKHLATLAWKGAAHRYPAGVPEKVRTNIAKELALIMQLGYARYFLAVRDIVRHAREKGILCHGRGSAANSVVCFCLGITAVDPTEIDLLSERFISAERREPPDIDVDFEHERREEAIQYIYDRHNRDRAGIAATVIHYRPKLAIRKGVTRWDCRRTRRQRCRRKAGPPATSCGPTRGCAKSASIPPSRGSAVRLRSHVNWSASRAICRSMSEASC